MKKNPLESVGQWRRRTGAPWPDGLVGAVIYDALSLGQQPWTVQSVDGQHVNLTRVGRRVTEKAASLMTWRILELPEAKQNPLANYTSYPQYGYEQFYRENPKKYPFYVFHEPTGFVMSGWDDREDALDAQDDLREMGWSDIKVLTHAAVVKRAGAVKWASHDETMHMRGNPSARKNFWGSSKPAGEKEVTFQYEIWTDSPRLPPLMRGSKTMPKSQIEAWRAKELATPGVTGVRVTLGGVRMYNNPKKNPAWIRAYNNPDRSRRRLTAGMLRAPVRCADCREACSDQDAWTTDDGETICLRCFNERQGDLPEVPMSRSRRNPWEPSYPATNAGPFLPGMFPYGMGGREMVFKSNPRKPTKVKASKPRIIFTSAESDIIQDNVGSPDFTNLQYGRKLKPILAAHGIPYDTGVLDILVSYDGNLFEYLAFLNKAKPHGDALVLLPSGTTWTTSQWALYHGIANDELVRRSQHPESRVNLSGGYFTLQPHNRALVAAREAKKVLMPKVAGTPVRSARRVREAKKNWGRFR